MEFLINGGKFEEIQEVRMPTTIQRLKMLREKRKAAIAKEKARKEAEAEERCEKKAEGGSKGSGEKPTKDDETESKEEDKAQEEPKKPPAEVVDLIGYSLIFELC